MEGKSPGRPPLNRLGFHRLGAVCLALQLGVLLLTVWAFWVTGLSYVSMAGRG